MQGKRGVWIKLPIQLVNLVETAVKVVISAVKTFNDYIHLCASHHVGYDMCNAVTGGMGTD